MYKAQSTLTTNIDAAVFVLALQGTGSLYDINRTNEWEHHVKLRAPFKIDFAASDVAILRPDVRTPAEHIKNIRDTLRAPVADLAFIFDVSRQAIYKWISGNSTPELDKYSRLKELSDIADKFKEEKIDRAATLLKMKTFDGRSLMDLIRTGENRNEHIFALISEAKAMERSYQESGMAKSKATATDDWLSSISIPGMSEQD